MSEYTLSILTSPGDIITYEKGLYQGYKHDPDGWIFKNYEKPGDYRLKSTLPYDDLVIYLCKKNDVIVAAMTMNTNIGDLELERMGFTFEKPNDRYSEGLTIFVDESEHGSLFEILVLMRNYMLDDIRSRGIKFVFGTTNIKFLTFHRFVFEWEVVETKNIDNEERCLLFGDVENWFMASKK